MTQPILILSAFIAGLPHRNVGEYIEQVNTGDTVVLQHDHTNQYDPSAVEVLHGTTSLGYVPREATPVIHSAWSQRFELTATVIEKPMTKWKEILIQVWASAPKE